ncbi:MAG: Hsp70 family protein [Treponema sp.]|nr:Hsp70 family protein [Treponema sp.]
MEYLLGIDLGTTNCSVTAIDENGKTTVIKNRDGEYITPSAVYFDDKIPNKFTIGKRAKEKASCDAKNLVTLVKREMGKSKDEVRFNKRKRAYNPYNYWGKTFSPEEISSKILAQLKKDAETALGQELKKVVITCPGYFGQDKKEATRLAGKLAGLDVIEVITEPVAASLSYGTKSDKNKEKVFVFDLGGGTFDVTIVNMESTPNGKKADIECLDGDSMLGGADWDQYLVSYMVDAFKKKYFIDLYTEKGEEVDNVLGKLRLDAESAKKLLTDNDTAEISITYGGKEFTKTITRADFVNITKPLTDKCMDYCSRLLANKNLTWSDIDTILVVGSMSNCFAVQNALKDLTDKDIAFRLVNPKTCVSEGAAIKAFYNICEKEGKKAVVQTLAKKPDYDKVDGDKNKISEIEEMEKSGERVSTMIESAKSVLPASISLKGHKGGKDFAKKFLNKDEQYPAERTMAVPLGFDDRAEVSITVLEGESENPSECDELGNAVLPLEGSHVSTDKVQVTFSIDINGIIQVAGVDLKTGKSVKAEIKRKNSISEEEQKAIIENALKEDDFTF